MFMFSGMKRRFGAAVAFLILYLVFLVVWLWFFADGTNPWLLSLGIQINFWRNWSIFILGFLIMCGLIGATCLGSRSRKTMETRDEE